MFYGLFAHFSAPSGGGWTAVGFSLSLGSLDCGSELGPALAERLGVPFVDRAIPLAVARRLGVDVHSAEEHDEQLGGGWLKRVLSGFAAQDAGGPVPVGSELTVNEDFCRATEEVLVAQAETGQGVILGRASVIVLRGRPDVLRVRLDGPAKRRAAQAATLGGISLEEARAALERVDRTHASYTSTFYGVDIEDPALYHLMIDSTAIGLGACVELLAVATRAVCAPAGADG